MPNLRPLGPNKKKSTAEDAEPPSWEDWANDVSRPLEGEAEYVGKVDPPMTLAQKKRIAAVIGGALLLALAFFAVNIVLSYNSEHSENGDDKKSADQTVAGSTQDKLSAAEKSVQQPEASSEDSVATLPSKASSEDDELAEVASKIKVVGLVNRPFSRSSSEMEGVAAMIKIVPLHVSPVAVPLPAAATQ